MKNPSQVLDAINIQLQALQAEQAKLKQALGSARQAFAGMHARIELAERHLAGLLSAIYGPPPGEGASPEAAASGTPATDRPKLEIVP
jgi:hypothetical protein